jgi:hypothetical protein
MFVAEPIDWPALFAWFAQQMPPHEAEAMRRLQFTPAMIADLDRAYARMVDLINRGEFDDAMEHFVRSCPVHTPNLFDVAIDPAAPRGDPIPALAGMLLDMARRSLAR